MLGARLSFAFVLGISLGAPRFLLAQLRASGPQLLAAGIEAYEDLETERAETLLSKAAAATDLAPSEKARAHLYLGLVRFEKGDSQKAKRDFEAALRLDRDIPVPDGVSPKIVQQLNAVRATLPPRNVEPPEPVPETPKPDPEGVPLGISDPPPPEIDPGPPWGWIGLGAGVLVAIAVVVTVVATQSDESSECEEDPGGCITFVVR